jgi:hypothetical protein
MLTMLEMLDEEVQDWNGHNRQSFGSLKSYGRYSALDSQYSAINGRSNKVRQKKNAEMGCTQQTSLIFSFTCIFSTMFSYFYCVTNQSRTTYGLTTHAEIPSRQGSGSYAGEGL